MHQLVTLTGVVSSLATTPGHTYTFRGKLYVDQSNSCTYLRVWRARCLSFPEPLNRAPILAAPRLKRLCSSGESVSAFPMYSWLWRTVLLKIFFSNPNCRAL